MTVPVQTIFNSYTANGVTTVFPYGFKITDAADLQVTVNGVVVTVGFTVSGVGVDGGGNVTFSVAPLNTQNVLIELFPVIDRLTDYPQFGDWLAPVVNNDFDRIWLALQKIYHDMTLAMKLSTDSTANASLPTPAANNFLGWNSAANAIINYAGLAATAVSAAMQPVINAATLAAARTALGCANLAGQAGQAFAGVFTGNLTGNADTSTTSTALAQGTRGYTLTAEQVTTSGTSIDFTGIPAWATKIWVMFNGVSTNGNNPIMVQIGPSAAPETTGYQATVFGNGVGLISTSAFPIDAGVISSGTWCAGIAILTLENAGAFRWAFISTISPNSTAVSYTCAGIKACAAALARVRITTVGGTDTFDAGAIAIAYE